MSDRLTDQARRVLRLAEDEARRFNQEYVGTDHLLLGILREGENPAARTLTRLGIGLTHVRLVMETFTRDRADPPGVVIPRTPRLREAIERAAQEAGRLGTDLSVGPEHLLLAVLRDPEGIASEVLVYLGHRPDRVRAAVYDDPEIAAIRPPSPPDITTAPGGSPLLDTPSPEPASENTQITKQGDQLQPGQQPARPLPAPTADLGMEVPDLKRPVTRSAFLAVLLNCWHLFLYFVGVNSAESLEADPTAPPLPPRPDGEDPRLPPGLRLTPDAREVVRLADREARQLEHDYLGTEHLLLGLLRSGKSKAVRVLRGLEIDPRRVRKELFRIIQKGQLGTPPSRLPITPRANAALDDAATEARDMGQELVGTEYLLLGLLREWEGVAAQVLLNLGVTLQQARDELHRLNKEE